MGTLFISHSSQNNDAAIKVRDWLNANGWTEVFLDLDPTHGLAPGQRWQQELKKAGERCSAVIALISPDWTASRWCQTEFLVADQLGKRIFPVLVAPMPFKQVPVEIRVRFHVVDVSTPDKESEGFERLAIGLKRAGLNPRSFEWPPQSDPHRQIYRGLQSLDEQDAAIFFGRDATITKGLDALRRMREGAAERMLVILGASGAGKSSFLKAGLISRLRRDEENFIVLPVMRPARAALSGSRGLAACLGCDPRRLNDAGDILEIFAERRAASMEHLRHLVAAIGGESQKPPSVIVPIDQAEELFSPENTEAARVLELLATSATEDDDVILILTIRSEAFAMLQSDSLFSSVPRLPFDLSPIPSGSFKEVIEAPASLAQPPLAIEPALTERLLKDLDSEDALPLLAFTLERLALRKHGGGTLALSEYLEELGGLQGAIVAAVDEAFASAARELALPDTRAELEKLARSAFIPALVRLESADSEPRRRLERMNALPQATRLLVRHLVNQHLLVSGRGIIDGQETDTIEIAHEAILRQWPALRTWIVEERDALRTLDAVRAAAKEWRLHTDNSGQGQGWLVHRGGRLQEAEALSKRADFSSAFTSVEREYLAACEASQEGELERERAHLIRTRKLQRNIGILMACGALVLLLAALAAERLFVGVAVRASSTLAAQAAKESESGYYDRGARYALAGLNEVDWPFMSGYGSAAEAELRRASMTSSALAVLSGHRDQVLGLAFSRDGKRIATASRDKTVRIWDATTGRPLPVVLRGHGQAVMSVAFSPDGTRIVTSSEDKTARIWDAATGREIKALRGHGDFVASAAFNADGTRVITASWDGKARIWDAKTGRVLATLHSSDDAVESASLSLDGRRAVTASDDGAAHIWDVASLREIATLKHGAVVESAAFSPDGTLVATACDDGKARVWSVDGGHGPTELVGHSKAVNSVAFSFDGGRIVTTSRDGTARIWDVRTGRGIILLQGHDGEVNNAVFSPDGKRVVTVSDDDTARIWDADVTREVMVLEGHKDTVNSIAVSRDGKKIATGSNDKSARIWDAATGAEEAVLSGHAGLVESVAFSPDGHRLATASDDRTARIWDIANNRTLFVLSGHSEAVYSVAFSPDGHRIVTASKDGTVRIWNADTGQAITALTNGRGHVESAVFDPNGHRVLAAFADKTAQLWDADTGRQIAVLRGHASMVSGAAFSPDGEQIVLASRDGTASIWSARTFLETAVLRGHAQDLLSAAFSPDGRRIVTASLDHTARIWDVSTAQEIATLRGHRGTVTAAVFTPDGRRVVTSSDDNTARVWNVVAAASITRSQLMRRACQTTLANGLSKFSPKELQATPLLDPRLDADVCHPAGLGMRLRNLFTIGASH